MRHFIGGSAAGLIIAIRYMPRYPGDTRMDWIFAAAGHIIIAAMFGVAAWGLWP